MAVGWLQKTQYGLNLKKNTLFTDFPNKSLIIKVNTVLTNFILAYPFSYDEVNLIPSKLDMQRKVSLHNSMF